MAPRSRAQTPPSPRFAAFLLVPPLVGCHVGRTSPPPSTESPAPSQPTVTEVPHAGSHDATSPAAATAHATFRVASTGLTLRQVDYEKAIYYDPGDPYPHLHADKVDRSTIVERTHAAVILENQYLKLTVLPAMGRVYAFHYKPTGHDNLWKNDVVNVLPQGGNPLGFWIWIGGIEYTLPTEEHGATFALPWSHQIVEDSADRKTVRMRIQEPKTQLIETIDLSIVPDRASFSASITLENPTDARVAYAHWVNPQMVPGGRNELTDHTEFVIPTKDILITPHWQKIMGAPARHDWETSRFRFLQGWRTMGDVIADGLTAGFYGAYSHDEHEGMVRVFDPEKTPGVDIWTYGYHPNNIPMGSGAPSKGYAEMWGGTTKMYGPERVHLDPKAKLSFTEWMYPFHKTGGLTFADEDAALAFTFDESSGTVRLGLCPSGPYSGTAEVLRGDEVVASWPIEARPDLPVTKELVLAAKRGPRRTAKAPPIRLRLRTATRPTLVLEARAPYKKPDVPVMAEKVAPPPS